MYGGSVCWADYNATALIAVQSECDATRGADRAVFDEVSSIKVVVCSGKPKRLLTFQQPPSAIWQAESHLEVPVQI